ncbi:MAG: folate-binding protein YgfZ [Candidatus Competibacteraceae bacterium]
MIKEWSDFLEQSGGWVANGRIEHFGHAESELWAVLNNRDTCCDLSHRGLIAVQGPDADLFLQGQLTCDVHQATHDHSVLGAFCSPKGRVLASFRLFRREGAAYLELPQELVEPTLIRLRKYVLRAKVTLTDASHQLLRFGMAGPHAETILTGGFGAIPEAINGVMHPTGDRQNITVIRLPGITPRFELYGPLLDMQAFWKTLAAVTRAGAEPWRLLDILAGIPTIYPETVEAFVPQMINLDALEGISFQKGCYTGQEVVARMHYLGKLKRRMYLARVDSPDRPHPGNPLFSPQADASQSAGRLVDAAEHPDGGYAVLAVALIECAEQGVLRLGDASGPELRLEPLPYTFGATA